MFDFHTANKKNQFNNSHKPINLLKSEIVNYFLILIEEKLLNIKKCRTIISF